MKIMTILEPKDIRQRNHWECGACASMAAASLFAVGPETLDGWVDLLGTSEEESTSPQAIIEAFTDLGLEVTEMHGMTIAELAEEIDAGRPVLVPCQDYTGVRSPKAEWDYGHWLVVCGVIPSEVGYIVCQDSSHENVENKPGGDVPKQSAEEAGDICAPGKALIEQATWLEAWHDVGQDGTEYFEYGISIGEK
jgi:hypothetical protein